MRCALNEELQAFNQLGGNGMQEADVQMFIPKCLISLMGKLWLLVQSPCCGRNVIPCQELCQPLYAIERLQMAAAFAH